MAKRTEKKPEYLAKIFKEYGNIISSGLDVLEEKKNYKTISVSPAIDIALGGGIKEGSWLTLTGDPKSGKTTTALQIAANCQKEGRPIIYLDVEGRLKDMNFEVRGDESSGLLRSGSYNRLYFFSDSSKRVRRRHDARKGRTPKSSLNLYQEDRTAPPKTARADYCCNPLYCKHGWLWETQNV